jgi:hypothetical protein
MKGYNDPQRLEMAIAMIVEVCQIGLVHLSGAAIWASTLDRG